jgi:triacylglycerol lipase
LEFQFGEIAPPTGDAQEVVEMASVVRSRLLLILGITSLAISAPAVAFAECMGDSGGGGGGPYEWPEEPVGGGGGTGGTGGSGGGTGGTGGTVAHDPVLFVHGWNGSANSWDTFTKWFLRDGWPSWDLEAWTYNSAQSNVTTAQEVSWHVDLLLKNTGAKKVDIVSHSMGGLSTRYYLKNLGGTAKVDEWVSLAGPNHGTNWANAVYGVTCFSAACEQMRVGSAFVKQLNEGDETPGAVNYGTWRDSELICDELIWPSSSVVLSGAAKNVFTPLCLGHSGFHESEPIYKEVREFIR